MRVAGTMRVRIIPFYLATGPITCECGSTVGVTGTRRGSVIGVIRADQTCNLDRTCNVLTLLCLNRWSIL